MKPPSLRPNGPPAGGLVGADYRRVRGVREETDAPGRACDGHRRRGAVADGVELPEEHQPSRPAPPRRDRDGIARPRQGAAVQLGPVGAARRTCNHELIRLRHRERRQHQLAGAAGIAVERRGPGPRARAVGYRAAQRGGQGAGHDVPWRKAAELAPQRLQALGRRRRRHGEPLGSHVVQESESRARVTVCILREREGHRTVGPPAPCVGEVGGYIAPEQRRDGQGRPQGEENPGAPPAERAHRAGRYHERQRRKGGGHRDPNRAVGGGHRALGAAAARHDLPGIELESPGQHQRQDPRQRDQMAAGVRRGAEAPISVRDAAGERVEPRRHEDPEEQHHQRDEMQHFQQRQPRQVERGIVAENGLADVERHGVTVQRDEIGDVRERHRRDNAEQECGPDGDPPERAAGDRLRDLQVAHAAGQVHGADGPVDGPGLRRVPQRRDERQDGLPRQVVSEARPVDGAEVEIREPRCLGEPDRRPTPSEQEQQDACDRVRGAAPPVHMLPMPTPSARSTASASRRISASCASVLASNRSTRIGCVLDARMRPQPPAVRQRTPSMVTVG